MADKIITHNLKEKTNTVTVTRKYILKELVTVGPTGYGYEPWKALKYELEFPVDVQLNPDDPNTKTTIIKTVHVNLNNEKTAEVVDKFLELINEHRENTNV